VTKNQLPNVLKNVRESDFRVQTFAPECLAVDFLVRRSRVVDREKSRQNVRHLPPVVIPLATARVLGFGGILFNGEETGVNDDRTNLRTT
jgi:hypothetical protein